MIAMFGCAGKHIVVPKLVEFVYWCGVWRRRCSR